MKKAISILILVLVAIALGCATKDKPKDLTDAQKAKLLYQYQKAMIAQASLQHAVDDYNATLKQSLKDSGFPDNTSVTVDLNKDLVTVTPAAPVNMQAKPTTQTPAK